MKKYIRTNDGIFKVVSKVNNTYWVEKNNNEFTIVNETQIKQKADTIEELCDELVLIEEDCPIILEKLDFKGMTYLRRNEYEFLSKLPEKPIIFGAIWTDRGLIYVAKMNEKGEMELL